MKEQHFALGMIETLGLPALITAADAAAKAANVSVVMYEKADAGITTVYIIGDVSSVKAAIDAGEYAAKQVGKLLHAHVIPRPDDSVALMIQKLLAGQVKNSRESGPDWQRQSVTELRKLARTIDNFPLSGREISTANKETLVVLLSEILPKGE